MYEEIKVVVIDLDGTLTNGMYQVSSSYDGDNDVVKSFYTRDFYGIEQLMRNGVIVIIISQSHDGAIHRQIERIASSSDFWNEQYVESGGLLILFRVDDKKTAINKWLSRVPELTWDNVAYIGDAENDIECMELAALSCCPSDAVDEVYQLAIWPSDLPGGKGAVYDVAMNLIKKQKEENNENS